MPDPTPVPDPELLAALRADLEAAGFTVDGVAAALGPLAGAALDREQVLPADLATRDTDEPVAVLVRLFALGRSVTPAAPRAGPADGRGRRPGAPRPRRGRGRPGARGVRPAALRRRAARVVGRLRPDRGGHQRAAARRTTCSGSAARRRPSRRGRPRPRGRHRRSTSAPAAACSRSTWPPTPGSVTATDLSARALAFARFNAALNGVDVGAARRGACSNPSPGGSSTWSSATRRSSSPRASSRCRCTSTATAGRPATRSCRGWCARSARVLEPGGIAQLLGNWEVGAASGATLARAGGGSGCDGTGLDAWVIQRDVQDPAEYAETVGPRRRAPAAEPRPSTRCTPRGWRDFASRGVEAIGFGVVTLQRPATDRAPVAAT